MDPLANFIKLTQVGTYTATAFAITVDSVAGLPNPTTQGAFNLVWYNATDFTDPTDDPNKEIVRVTGISGNVLTLANSGSNRVAQEGTTTSVKNGAGKTYKFILAVTKNTFDDIAAFIKQLPQGSMINGKIVTSVATNNLTVAIKTLAGNDPSVDDVVYVRIGNTVRAITTATTMTMAAATNWFNAGSAEHATKEIDYFAYLGWNAVTSLVMFAVARIPYARVLGDFTASTTAEKGINYINATSAVATDEFEVIGRFNAILSAGAGYTWSIPATSVIVNRPIYETRVLSYTPTLTWTAGLAPATPTTPNNIYQITGRMCYVRASNIYTTNGTTVTKLEVTMPFTGAATLTQSPNGAGVFSNTFAPIATMNQADTNKAQLYCASSTVNRWGFSLTYEL